jgi:hypothetical protein
MLYTTTQEKNPPDPTNRPTYIKYTWRDKKIRTLTAHQVARDHIRPKLSFRQHIQHLASRGAAAAGCMRMLATTNGGLSYQNMKMLYNICILPALSCAAPVWWNGKGGQIQKIETIQNRSLRTILPVFKTTPIHAMKVESGIPPLQIQLNYMKQRAAARLAAKIDPTNPIYDRLPTQL